MTYRHVSEAPSERPLAIETPQTSSTKPRALLHIVALVLALGVALAFRVYRIQDECLWFDEVVSYQYLNAPNLVQFLRLERGTDPPMTPVYFSLEYAWAHVFSDSVLSLRFLSLSAGMLTLLLSYGFARRAFGPSAGLVAAWSLALSMPHIYFAQEIRMYSLTALLAVASTYSLYKAVNGGSRNWWLANVLANMILVWTHFIASLLVVAEGAFLLISYWRNRRLLALWSLAQAPAVAALAGWISTIDFAALSSAAAWIERPGWRDVLRIGYWFPNFLIVRPDTLAINPKLFRAYLLGAAVSYLLVLWLGAHLIRRDVAEREAAAHARKLEAYALLFLWMAVPPVALLILTFVARPCFVDRYMFHATVPMYILVGGALGSIPSRRWRLVAVVMLFSLYAYHLPQLIRPIRGDYRAATAIIASESHPDDWVFMAPAYRVLTLRYYSNLPDDQLWGAADYEDLAAHAARTVSQGTDVWLLLYEFRPDYPADFERCLDDRALPFTKTFVEGLQRIFLYHVTARGAPPAIAGGSIKN